MDCGVQQYALVAKKEIAGNVLGKTFLLVIIVEACIVCVHNVRQNEI